MGSEARARLGAAGLLAATLLSFAQLFAEPDFAGPCLLGMVIATGLIMGMRRIGAPVAVTALASTMLLGIYLAVIFRGAATFYGLPTLAALLGVVNAVEASLARVAFDFAPVPVRSGYVILVVVGFWIAASISELATFRWRRPLLAAVPSMALFSAAMILGTGAGGVVLVVLFIAALLTFWALESSHGLRSWGRWVPTWAGHEEDGPPANLTGAIARKMGASCVLAALVAPFVLPAFDTELLAWRSGIGGEGPGAGGSAFNNQAISDPFVSVQPRLVSQSEDVQFTVRAEQAAYWRLVSLGNFDGESWQPRAYQGFDVDQGGFEPVTPPSPGHSRPLQQVVTIRALAGEYLPAAVQAVELERDDGGVYDNARVDPSSGFLQVAGGVAPDISYTVESSVPEFSYGSLRSAQPGEPPVDGETYRELPSISPEVQDLSERWTRGAQTPFDELLAIQDRLRTFAYSQDVAPLATEDYLTEFLTHRREGYCQQFATAFAVLARLQGYAARVSVGFLPGQLAPDGETYVVRGVDAHAWPEVYFEDRGWVAFEPTPRSDGESEPFPYTQPQTAGGPGGTAGLPRPGASPSRLRGSIQNANAPATPSPEAVTGVLPDGPRDLAWERTFGRIATGLSIVLLTGLTLVPLLKQARIVRRYRRARGTAALAAAAFAEFQQEAGELAAPRAPAESAAAYATRLASEHEVPLGSASRLASIYEAAEYSASEPHPAQAAEARRLVRQLRRRMWSSASWWARAVRLFSPRGVWGI